MDTPGMKLFKEILAKSIAKINANDGQVIVGNNSTKYMKRKFKSDSTVKKKKTRVKHSKSESLKFSENKISSTNVKSEVNVDHDTRDNEEKHNLTSRTCRKATIECEYKEAIKKETEVKSEYVEVDSEPIQMKKEKVNRKIKKEIEAKNNYEEFKGEETLMKVMEIKDQVEFAEKGSEKEMLEKVTPGKALILELLAKSVAKYNDNGPDYGLHKSSYCNGKKNEGTNKEKKHAEAIDDKTEVTVVLSNDSRCKTEYKEVDTGLATNTSHKPDKIVIKSATDSQEDNVIDNKKNINTKTKKVRKARQSGKELNRFTPEEDQILLQEMETYGEEVNFSKLAKQLNRTYKTISVRIAKLKTGKSWREVRAYTLMEDLVIIDAVLEELPGKTLAKLDLPSFKKWKVVGDQIGRQERHVKYRWEYYLKTWLLQYYSGTLNYDIRRMLANYLADHFNDVGSVDWPEVSNRPEFAGHTETSLKYIFYTFLFKQTKEKMEKSSDEITLELIAEQANKQFKESKRLITIREKTLARQREVIEYFERCIKNRDLTFNLY